MRRSALTQLVQRIGATFEDDGIAIMVDAPAHHHFVGYDVHWFTIAYDAPPGAWAKPEAYAEMAENIRDGVEPCEPDCECFDEQEVQ